MSYIVGRKREIKELDVLLCRMEICQFAERKTANLPNKKD